MRRKRYLIIVLLLFITPLLTSCWDRFEVEDISFLISMGIDKGTKFRYIITVAIAIPENFGKDSTGKKYLVTSVEAPTINAALTMIGTYAGRRVSLQHTKALFMGEALARESGLNAIDEFLRLHQARRSTLYFVTKGKAVDFLNQVESKINTDPQRLVEGLNYTSRNTGVLPSISQIQTFVTTVNMGYIQPMTYYAAIHEGGEVPGNYLEVEAGRLPRKGGPNAEVLGAAAFRKDKMVGVLTALDVRLILMVQNQFRSGFTSFPDPKNPTVYFTMDVRSARPTRVQADVKQKRPQLNIHVDLEGELVAVQSGIDYTDPKMQGVIEQAAEQNAAVEFDRLVKKTQAWNSDVLGLGNTVVKAFPTVEAWNQYDWPSKYKDAEIKFDVSLKLRRFGLQLAPPTASS
jgi:spore germination protein KC